MESQNRLQRSSVGNLLQKRVHVSPAFENVCLNALYNKVGGSYLPPQHKITRQLVTSMYCVARATIFGSLVDSVSGMGQVSASRCWGGEGAGCHVTHAFFVQAGLSLKSLRGGWRGVARDR